MPVTGKQTFTFNDKSAESGSITLNVDVITELNAVAQGALRDSFRTALDAICLGLPIRETSSNIDTINPTNLASASGNRELKYAIDYYDSVTFARGQMEVPIVDDSLTLPASDVIDTTNALYIQFKTAVEAYAKSPQGNAIVITGGRLVGRNL